MQSDYQLSRFRDNDGMMDFKSDFLQRIQKNNLRMQVSERKMKDGTIKQKVRFTPMSTADYIGAWAIAMLKSLILIFFLFIAYQIYQDIQANIEISKTKTMIEMKNCGVEYEQNQCSEHFFIDSMAQRCKELEICINQDIEMKVRTKQLWLKVLGNSFENIFEDLSYKTCVMLTLIAITLSVFFNICSQFQYHQMFRGNFNRQSLKPQVVTFQYVLDQINVLDHRALSLLQKMVNPSQMNIFATAALVSLFAGLIREIPCELLDEKKLNWSLLNMFLNDVEKFLENLRKFKDFINKNQITSKNMQIANYWIQKYNEIQQDNQYSVSYAFIQITQMVIKLDKQINQRLPSSPARSLSASPSPKMNDNDDIDEIDELKSQAERISVKDPVKPKGLKLQLVPNKPIQSTVGHKHTQSQQIKQIQSIHAPVVPKKK
ncbi:unnamed protein product (macronuclear) [Paramecium tetraurelia]|uniref:Brl1/Brr6 domain-containing protein n=1 Tax=Paramecium tetraurelia TaxID=5888 RepID=A0CXU9_PARTE|nr:uncharacterized protein GSPATT00011248001 [Paramecium tetraurelia]CAK75616.1 unnamed protein product [Paramecium tetraurelia]|eukprot:XP_001443013.1 hypothetical protein (macronuclear) [Paramecium tetraurelia strain d4-2]